MTNWTFETRIDKRGAVWQMKDKPVCVTEGPDDDRRLVGMGRAGMGTDDSRGGGIRCPIQ